MFKAARYVASGRHSSILAIPSEDATDAWTVLKVVSTPRAGRSIGSKPHDVHQEVQILDRLSHPNVIGMLGYKYDTNLHEYHIQLPFLPLSLSDLLPQQLHPDVVQSVIFQILLALTHVHAEGVAHRDINPNNIMIDWDGSVKLIDLGVAWTGGDTAAEGDKAWYETKEEMICDVGTGRWRAPELLFSPTTYDAFAIDLWALGVIITDMHDHILPHPESDDASDEEEELRDPLDEDDGPRLIRKPLFDDRYGDIGLAGSIFRILGTPTDETWPEFDKLPDAGKIDFIHCDPQSLDALFPDTNQDLLDLTTRLLRLSPSHRISAKEALKHPYFESTLVPAKGGVWYGSDPRVDLSRVCVVEKEGRRLIDHLGEALDSRREYWGIPE